MRRSRIFSTSEFVGDGEEGTCADNVEGVVIKGSGHWLMEEAAGSGHSEARGILDTLSSLDF